MFENKQIDYKKHVWILFVFLCVVLFDQISKFLIDRNMVEHESIRVIGNFFRLSYVRNSGIIFGFFSGANFKYQTLLFLVLSLIAVGFVIYTYITSNKETWIQISLGMILGGALGNIVDRIRIGEVIDFLDFGIGHRYRWYTFNVADSCILIGIVLLILLSYITEEKKIG